MDKTPNLHLPYILSSQAQKHITHNDAIRALDALVHLSVLSNDLTVPPSTPSEGDRYIVHSNPSNEWIGQDNKIAAWQDGTWQFYAPQKGWVCWIENDENLLAFNGLNWINAGTESIASINPTPLVGVNATADTTNRLSVNSPAILFNHEGNGHQVKVNKNADTDNASVLFQTDFSGRAEFGLTGDNNFHMKVSPDGNTFHEGIIIDKDTGNVAIGGDEPREKLHVQSGNILLDNNRRLLVKDTSGNNQRIFHMGADNNCYFNVNELANRVRFFTSSTMRLDVHENGSIVVGSPSGGGKGTGTINAQAVYDDNTLLSCYVFDQAIDKNIKHEKWDQKVLDLTNNDDAIIQKRTHSPMRKFKARAGTKYDPLTLDGYAKHWKDKRHLTSMPNEEKYDIKKGMSSGEWIQRLIETVEIQAILIEELNTDIKKLKRKI